MDDKVKALQWLFGEEWYVESYLKGDERFLLLASTDHFTECESDKARDKAHICHLIDERLLERDLACHLQESKFKYGVLFDMLTDTGWVRTPQPPRDPLTARIEAVKKLMGKCDE